MLYIRTMKRTYNETPEATLSVNFSLCGENLIKRCKMAEIIEEVCEVGLENLRKNFWVEELFSARIVSRYFPL